jgi:hypothetical protein
MTEDQYFNGHIPHRVNLLTTFRNRYSRRRSGRIAVRQPRQPWDQPRDFFRCSKDISILMVRFFCDEMGLHLPENASEPKDRKKRNGKPWQPRFKCKRFTVADAKKDRKFDSLVAVLKAANRAVAHINKLDVDHGFKTQADHEPLFDVIDWIEDLIETHMYQPNDRRSLSAAMELRNNVM